MNKEVTAFLGVSGREKDGRVQFAVTGSNFWKGLIANDNYQAVDYFIDKVTGELEISVVDEGIGTDFLSKRFNETT